MNFDVDTYEFSCDHVLGDVVTLVPTPIFTTLHHQITCSRGEGSIPRTRQSMFEGDLAELDKALFLKLSDPARGAELRLRKDLSTLSQEAGQYTNKPSRLQR